MTKSASKCKCFPVIILADEFKFGKYAILDILTTDLNKQKNN